MISRTSAQCLNKNLTRLALSHSIPILCGMSDFDNHDLPFELQEDPSENLQKEPKVVRTLISRRPKDQGVLIGFLLIFVCSLISLMSWQNQTLFDSLAASWNLVFEKGEVHRLISSLFLHGDLGHLLSNSYMLFVLSVFIFGTLTLSFSGALALMAFTLIGGALVNILTLYSYPPQTRLLGISGVVYLLAGFWFVNYLLIDRRRRFPSRLLRVLGVSLVILFPSTFEEEVSYLAHFHGFWLGLVMGTGFFYLFKKQIRSFEEVSY